MLGLALCLLFCVSVQGQLIMRWNGTAITNVPTLIYHDELLDSTGPITSPEGPGRLICITSTPGQIIHWAFPPDLSRIPAGNNSYNFYHARRNMSHQSLSRLSRNTANLRMNGQISNGLWRCNEDDGPTLYVGIYARGQGAIMNNSVTLRTITPFRFNNFTLTGSTVGGPPTAHVWRRNGIDITRDSEMIGNASVTIMNGLTVGARLDSYYTSTLEISGYFPGVYEYVVSNRATTSTVTDNFSIQGGGPSNLTAIQTGLQTVQVSWSTPVVPPGNGYNITTNSSSEIARATFPPHNITISEPGFHTIRVVYRSQHFPGKMEELSGVLLSGPLAAVVTISPEYITATTVTVSWNQPPFSFTPVSHNITLRRITGSNQLLCVEVSDDRAPILTSATSQVFSNLQEFSSYQVIVTATFIEFGDVLNIPTTTNFTTSMAAPTATPGSVMVNTVTSNTISVSWDVINCIDQNGPITGYEVEYMRADGNITNVEVMARTFTASELQPFTNYTFSVAGSNSEGRGPFTTAITIRTNEDVPGVVSGLVAEAQFASVLFSWVPLSPQESNGIIIAYEFSYRVNNSQDYERVNYTTHTFTIALTPNTTVSNISVRAYTSVGPGGATSTGDVFISATLPIPAVRGLRVMYTSEGNVIVSWDRIDIDLITNYTLYYSQLSSNNNREITLSLPATNNSVVITDLVNGAEYQFRVVAMAALLSHASSDVENSSVVYFSVPLTTAPAVTSQPTGSSQQNLFSVGVLSITAAVSSISTFLLYSMLLLLGCHIFHLRRSRSFKPKLDVNELSLRKGVNKDLWEREAYATVKTNQQDQEQDYIYEQPDLTSPDKVDSESDDYEAMTMKQFP